MCLQINRREYKNILYLYTPLPHEGTLYAYTPYDNSSDCHIQWWISIRCILWYIKWWSDSNTTRITIIMTMCSWLHAIVYKYVMKSDAMSR